MTRNIMSLARLKPLKPYHLAWLEAHPARSEAWLRERMGDGFDIHHVDGDKANNAPQNLVLIEAADHMMLHCGTRFLRMTNADRLRATRRAPRGSFNRFGLTDEQIRENLTKSRLYGASAVHGEGEA
jgi:hypothetical protein